MDINDLNDLKKDLNFSLSEEDLDKAKKSIEGLIRKVNLSAQISLKEIEQELKKTEKIYESYLFLGIMTRLLQENKDDLVIEVFLPSITAWKNFLPCDDLGGLSPVEYERKHPRGVSETLITAQLLMDYHKRLKVLDKQRREIIDAEKDFQKFQNDFLELIPLNQPFQDVEKILNNREIIVEERKRNGYPEDKIDKISIALFAENIASKIGNGIAELEDGYLSALEELSFMQERKKQRGIGKVKRIFKSFLRLEPFMKCTKDSFRFYKNFANAAFLCDFEEMALELLRKSLLINPNYKEAKQALESFKEFYGKI